MKKLTLFFGLILLTTGLFAQKIPTYQISQIKSVNINGKADSAGVYCKIEAVVQSINFRVNEYLFFINDGTGGLAVKDFDGNLKTPYKVTRGDKIRIIGKITQEWNSGSFAGETNMVPDSIVLISSGHKTLPPVVVTQVSEQHEGLYVTVKNLQQIYPENGYWSNSGKRFHVFIHNKDNTGSNNYLRIHVHDNSEVYQLAEPTKTFNLSGFVGQWDFSNPQLNRYYLNPQFESDLERLPPSIPIDSIQYVNPDSLKIGSDDPMYFNYKDTVTIEGVVMMHPGFFAEKGTKKTWLQSESGKEWGGIQVHAWPIWHGMTTSQLLDSLDMYEKYRRGYKIKVRGLTYDYINNTEIVLLPEKPEIIQKNVKIEPKVLNIGAFVKGKGSGRQNQVETGEKWENVFVQFNDVWVSRHYTFAPGHYWFFVIDKDSNEIQVYPNSAYFRGDDLSDSLSAGYTYNMPPVGTNLEYVRGMITDYRGKYELSPMYPEDVKLRSLKPEICMVMVDTNSNRNMVVWERPQSTKIDSYRVYRESTQANKYELVGSTAYNELSVIIDTNSIPLQRAYRYALSVIDKNGIESEWSEIHKTLHLTANKGTGSEVNLIWNGYEGFPISTYKIYRGTTPYNLSLIDSIQSSLNSYTDLNPPSGLVFYQIIIDKKDTCYPAIIRANNNSGPFSQSLSNIKDYNTLQKDYLEVHPKTIPVNKDEGTYTFKVYTNLAVWIVQASEKWVSYQQDLANNTVTLYFGENTTGSERRAKLTLIGAGVDNFEITLVQSASGNVSVKESNDHALNIFPNPAQNQVTLAKSDLMRFESIQLIDINGKIHKEIRPKANSILIDIKDLPAGVYMLKLNGTNATSTKLLIK